MALIKCKECSATIAESAQFCPACGFTYERPKTKFQAFNTVSGPLIVSAATAILGLIAFLHKTETQETEKLQSMIESAVNTDPAKERTAVRIVTYLAKLNKLSGSFALSILGTVARNRVDDKVRSEAYDAIENLTDKRSSRLVKFDEYDQLEILCLYAALTPGQSRRWLKIHEIEKYSSDEVRKYQAASKLLSLAQDIANPQAVIDLLLSVPVRLNDPDMIERAIPTLCKAVKDRASQGANNDVADILKQVATESVAKDNETVRSQIRLYLASALVTKDAAFQDSSLKEVARAVALNPDLDFDTKQLFDGVASSLEADAKSIVDSARKHLTPKTQQPVAQLTKQS
jgi:hypothetical protein